MVFKVRYSEDFKSYYLEPYSEKFQMPDKIYGNLDKKAIRVWNTYVKEKKSIGVLLIGSQGSGKSLTGNILSNIAIDNGLPVIMVSEIHVDHTLIAYLSNLKNCVLYIDEFGKMMYSSEQNNLLTMLSDPINTKKIIILTENFTHNINTHILNRPGRIRYRYDFNKLEKEDLLEYLNDQKVEEEFQRELVEIYVSAKVFSFDILTAIIKEHKQYPNDSLKHLLNVLNVKIIATPLCWKVVEVKKEISKGKYEDQIFTCNSGLLKSSTFKDNYPFTVYINLYKDDEDASNNEKKYETISISNERGDENYKIVSLDNNTVVLKRKNYLIKFELREKEDMDMSDDSSSSRVFNPFSAGSSPISGFFQ